ncbi:MAG: helix-turn-helix domain-containing protein [Halobacteriales archaeon]|nr:helix-turn-helix domain-containing protein [Halobacteriales archaeon]
MSETEERERTRVIGVDSDDADDLIGALSSETARKMLSELHDEPAAPSEVAERAGTTVQNARYHLENLKDAGLIEVEGTRYSPKGREMDVYAPAEPLVMFVGREEDSTTLRDAVKRFFGVVGVIGIAAVFVEYLFRLYAPGTAAPQDDGATEESGDGGMGAFDAESDAPSVDGQGRVEEAESVVETAPTLVERLVELPPGVVFFATATAVTVVVLGVWYVRNRGDGESHDTEG